MRILFLTITALLSSLAFAADAPWRLEKDKDSIQIYSRSVPGWDINEMRGVTRVPGRLSGVVAVINDLSALPELTDVVAQADLQHRDSPTRYQFYSVMKLPWPVSNRDILNQREIAQDPVSRVVTITDTATQDLMPPKQGLVRIVRSRQQWTLKPEAGGVRVELQLLSDPAGPIPSAVINAMAVSTPYKTLSKLKQLVQRPAYARATLPFIKEGG